MLPDLAPKGAEQLALFDAPPVVTEDRRSDVMRVMDTVNAKWGCGTLGICNAGLQGARGWSMQRRMLSPRYTTQWSELPTVRA